MSTNSNPIEEKDLHAYVDGQLDAQRREEVEEWLASNPEDAQRAKDYQQQNQAMHALFDPVLTEPVSKTLSESVSEVLVSNSEQQSVQGLSNKIPLLRFAAMIGFMFFGGIIGYAIRDLAPVTDTAHSMASMPRQATIAHLVYTPEVLHPVEVTAEQETHLSKWLSKRLGTDLHVPHLSPLGFSLMGGRLLPGEDGPAAQFMYENAQGKRLTLYVTSVEENANETAFQYDQQNDVSVFYWVDGPLGYVLSGEIDKQGLLEAAKEVYRVINL